MGRLFTVSFEPVNELSFQNIILRGAWVGQSVKRLPSAQIMISGSWMESCLGLPAQRGVGFLPLSLPPLVLPVSLSLKYFFK